MTPAERIYRLLLWLYPAKHRQAYGSLMLQHARDLSRATRQRGRWHMAILCLRLMMDGIANAFVEHKEAIENLTRAINFGANKVRFYTPVPEGARVRARARVRGS